jgi:anti-anti-sigma regulatory factor
MRRMTMTERSDPPPRPAVVLDPNAADGLATQLRRAFDAAAHGAVVIDLRLVSAVDTEFLRALGARVEAGGEIVVAGVAPEVYKALHVAGLAGRVRRASPSDA